MIIYYYFYKTVVHEKDIRDISNDATNMQHF